MLFHSIVLLLGISVSNALPLDHAQAPRKLAQRAKSYAVVNVDGGSTASTTLSQVTTTVLQPITVIPKVTSSTSISTPEPSPEPSPEPTPEPKPILVTVVITETASPTKFYDDGMWHTSYPVKTFEEIATPTVTPSSSYNQTFGRRLK
jgi:hypothetical protein